jgi:hypothetical protein
LKRALKKGSFWTFQKKWFFNGIFSGKSVFLDGLLKKAKNQQKRLFLRRFSDLRMFKKTHLKKGLKTGVKNRSFFPLF